MYPKATLENGQTIKMFSIPLKCLGSLTKSQFWLSRIRLQPKKGKHNNFGAHHLSPVSAARLIEPYCDTEIKI